MDKYTVSPIFIPSLFFFIFFWGGRGRIRKWLEERWGISRLVGVTWSLFSGGGGGGGTCSYLQFANLQLLMAICFPEVDDLFKILGKKASGFVGGKTVQTAN